MEIGESIVPPKSNRHNSTCPICNGKKPKTLGYTTIKGENKDEDKLGEYLAQKGKVKSDDRVGDIYPFEGGNEPHEGWEIEEGVLLDSKKVDVPCTPHHLLPGAVMSKSNLEKDGWTIKGSQIIEDIGYNIDSAKNGIWLPHLPAIHWTKEVEVNGKKLKLNELYGLFSEIGDKQQLAIGHILMGDTRLQMHYTGHGSTKKNAKSYNKEALDRLDELAKLMKTFWSKKCEKGKSDDKIFPPYGLNLRINLQSLYLELRIKGAPRSWKSWVSPLAKSYTKALKDKKDIQPPRVLSAKH
jgi:hypothetical protein